MKRFLIPRQTKKVPEPRSRAESDFPASAYKRRLVDQTLASRWNPTTSATTPYFLPSTICPHSHADLRKDAHGQDHHSRGREL